MWCKKPHQNNTLIFLILEDEIIYERIIEDNDKAAKLIDTFNLYQRDYHEMSKM